MGKHIVISGGGTGGHLFPGVAVVEAMQELDTSLRFTFVGAARGIEARAIPALGYDLELLSVKPLMAGGLAGKLAGLSSLPVSGVQAALIHRRLQPDLVLAVGGYAAGPFTAWASLMGTKTALLEQNALPGFTNRMLAKVVDRGYLSFESTRTYFPSSENFVNGNPIRSKLLKAAQTFKYSQYSGEGEFRILVIGGSGGARSLNRGVPEALKQLQPDLQKRVVVTHQAGRGRTSEAEPRYSGFTGTANVVEFIDDMAAAYGDAHLLICRAGMSTIAEVTVLGIPALYVPLPTGDGHQIANATEIVDAGGGLMVMDEEIGTEVALGLIDAVMRDPALLQDLARQAKTLGHPQAANEVAKSCLEWIG